jgi:acyl-coenzyme A synthetase/AMP-(fatty) acid ligase
VAFSDGRLPRNPSGKIQKRELRELFFPDGPTDERPQR